MPAASKRRGSSKQRGPFIYAGRRDTDDDARSLEASFLDCDRYRRCDGTTNTASTLGTDSFTLVSEREAAPTETQKAPSEPAIRDSKRRTALTGGPLFPVRNLLPL